MSKKKRSFVKVRLLIVFHKSIIHIGDKASFYLCHHLNSTFSRPSVRKTNGRKMSFIYSKIFLKGISTHLVCCFWSWDGAGKLLLHRLCSHVLFVDSLVWNFIMFSWSWLLFVTYAMQLLPVILLCNLYNTVVSRVIIPVVLHRHQSTDNIWLKIWRNKLSKIIYIYGK